MRIVKNFQIKLDEKEIIRFLRSENSNKKSSKKPPQSLIDELQEMMKIALKLIHPIGMYEIFESSDLEPRFLFKKSEKTVLAICTIGKNLESKSYEYMKEGELAKGVFLDAIASHAAEQTAECLNHIILEEISEEIKGKEYTCRFSPGYCQWILEEGQNLIFNLLDADKINVKLSASKMMNPVKSVSFALNIGEKVDKDLGTRDCEDCDLTNCAYRRRERDHISN